MLGRYRLPPARGGRAEEQALEALALRLRRLAAHPGYLRREVSSPLLKRLMPFRLPDDSPAAQIAELRRRLMQARLDGDAVAYLIETVETELDDARLRLV